ncbi:hypothetical protein [Marinococcus luteus]|nr:hypothetical protein [Marinococcus luteus]
MIIAVIFHDRAALKEKSEGKTIIAVRKRLFSMIAKEKNYEILNKN